MRPTKYDKSVLGKVEQYLKPFRIKLTGRRQFYELPTLAGLADFLNVNRSTLHRWGKNHKELCNALGCLMALQEYFLIQNGLNNRYNATICKLILSSNHGYRDRSEKIDDPPPEDPMSLENIVERVKAIDEAGDGLTLE